MVDDDELTPDEQDEARLRSLSDDELTDLRTRLARELMRADDEAHRRGQVDLPQF